MARFRRRLPLPVSGRPYRTYKPRLRVDFEQRCAYCLVAEDDAQGDRAFEIDHLRPKSRPEFAHLEREYSNLYWSCRTCNGEKSEDWPTDEELQAGCKFVDLCEDEVEDHYEVQDDGTLKYKTASAEYTARALLLDRELLARLRRALIALHGSDWHRKNVLDAVLAFQPRGAVEPG